MELRPYVRASHDFSPCLMFFLGQKDKRYIRPRLGYFQPLSHSRDSSPISTSRGAKMYHHAKDMFLMFLCLNILPLCLYYRSPGKNNEVNFLFLARLSLSLDKIGCGSA